MIVGLRSVIMCDKVEVDADGNMNILGLMGDTLQAPSEPGLAEAWLFLGVELDGRGSVGQVKLTAPDYAFSVPFDVPAGVRLTGFSFPVAVPVMSPGALHIAVVEDAKRAKPIRARWSIGFHRDAEVLDEAAGRAFIEAARANAERIQANLERKNKH